MDDSKMEALRKIEYQSALESDIKSPSFKRMSRNETINKQVNAQIICFFFFMFLSTFKKVQYVYTMVKTPLS